ncbi:MAG: HAMP domain-containing histidine kinase [Candidatus Aminicenantes bacterium]|nr:HAMP domain-containing histidine kinase [Candidatus Aminicenantes bacterium]
MEALLSPRHKNVIVGCLLAALAGIAAASAFFPSRDWPQARIAEMVEMDCRRMEAVLDAKVRQCLLRSGSLARAYAAGRLAPGLLERKESLVMEKDGIVTDYIGEIFHYKPLDLPEGGWRLTRKNQDVYFMRRVAPHSYYIGYFMDMRANPVRAAARYPYPLFDLRLAGQGLPAAPKDFSYDQARKRFYYSRPLAPAGSQLIVTLVFSRATLEGHFQRRRMVRAYGLAFLLFLILFLLLRGGRTVQRVLRLGAAAAMVLASWSGIAWLGVKDVYFTAFPWLARSVHQLILPLALLLLGLWAGRSLARRPKNGLLALLAFDAAAAAAFLGIDVLLHSVEFPYGEFVLDPGYLSLLALLAGLHLLPLLVGAPFVGGEGGGRRSWPLLPLQAALVFILCRFLPLPPIPLILLSLAFFLLLRRPPQAWMRIGAPLVALAIALSFWLGQTTRLEKKAFISGNLKPIFASQDHYAKLVAREIVYELNSRHASFSSFFEPGDGNELADSWKNTLAARESIASGIYVVRADGRMLRAFSHQVPYIRLRRENIFPFWHVENVEADLFGKSVSLAVATINVFQEGRHLGHVMVQVLNTAELVLKSREGRSILTLHPRVAGAGIGYIKLDENRRLRENPGNINVGDLGGLQGAGGGWVRFRSLGVTYCGTVIADEVGTTIIFFPEDTFFKSFSEFVMALLFLLLLASLLNLRRLRRFHWRSVFGSFSVKVFAILLLLSMLTAAVFSLFSLNFHFQSQETQRIRAAHDRGRAALNVIHNLLAAGDELTQRHMFLLENILENNISVYENGTLLFTSDLRKIIRSQLPIYLNSGIRDLLGRDSQRFELRRSDSSMDLFFQARGKYVFDIEFPFDGSDQLRARHYYVDFMVTIFFILIAIGLAAAFFFRGKILAPIHRLNRGMAEVQQGNLSPLEGLPAEIELRELYQGFNSMLQGIQEQKTSASEIARMKTLVQLGRRVAHEVKNPLTPIRLSAEQIQRSLRDRDGGGREVIANAVRYIIEETEHLRRVAFGFLNLSKLDELQVDPFRLDELVAEAVSRLQSIHPLVRFTMVADEAIPVVADRRKIRQVIDNVLTNALEALAGREGRIEVNLFQDEHWVEVRVQDNGEGIAADELERIATEEFSSKDLGTGLGLVIARRFLELHGGGLEIHSRMGEGTIVVMRFAKYAPQA